MTGMFVWTLVAFGIFAGVLTAYAGLRLAPFAPTPTRAVAAALALADVGPGDTVMDLGAGDGRVVIAAARRGARAIGYELSPFVFILALARTCWSGTAARVLLRDTFVVDLSPATVVFLFGMPRTSPRVAAHLARTLRPGTRVLTYIFPLPGWTTQRSVQPPRCGRIWLYCTPQ